jgi:hypothetical protein
MYMHKLFRRGVCAAQGGPMGPQEGHGLYNRKGDVFYFHKLIQVKNNE